MYRNMLNIKFLLSVDFFNPQYYIIQYNMLLLKMVLIKFF